MPQLLPLHLLLLATDLVLLVLHLLLALALDLCLLLLVLEELLPLLLLTLLTCQLLQLLLLHLHSALALQLLDALALAPLSLLLRRRRLRTVLLGGPLALVLGLLRLARLALSLLDGAYHLQPEVGANKIR